jgi:hypothetical protein
MAGGGLGGFYLLPRAERILDTRTTTGGHKAPMHDGEELTILVAGQFGLPPDIMGVIGNLTVVNATHPGFVVVYMADPSGPPSTSNLNFGVSAPIANMVASRLGWDPTITPSTLGRFSIRTSVVSSGTVNVIFDLMGFST